MAALALARSGKRVLVLERGPWAARDETAWSPRSILLEQKYRSLTPYEAPQFGGRKLVYPNEAVGGNSVFYGAASFRLRELDFRRRSEYEGNDTIPDGFVDWPISYSELSPFYDQAETLLGVVGELEGDPTEPPRTQDYGGQPPPYGFHAKKLVDAAQGLGLHPFHVPLAINFAGNHGRPKCIKCMTCDLFPCKVCAKNDISVTVLPAAQKLGAEIRGGIVVTNVAHHAGRVTGVVGIDTSTGESFKETSDVVIVSAGALASPRLLIASGISDLGAGGRWIGRYLMRHCSGIVIGLCSFETNPEKMFHKQVAITDFYLGSKSERGPRGPWGAIQGLQVPPPEYVRGQAPFPFDRLGELTIPYQLFLLCIAEDVPNADNRVALHPHRRDEFDLSIARIEHRYCRRDLAGRNALLRQAARVLKSAGAKLRVRKTINTFSHAIGTCRFGHDPATSALDEHCRVHGVPNLFVIDGSFMPTAGGLNPSLTIAANALRVGEHLATHWEVYAQGTGE